MLEQIYHPDVISFVKDRDGEKRTRVSQANPRDPVVAKWFGMQNETESGVYVDEETALRVSTCYACVKVLAESIAMLPLLLRVYDGDASSDEARGYYLNSLLKRRPNKWQTPVEYKEMMATHVILRGAAYSRIIMGGDGRVEQLIPLHPDRITPFMAPDGTRCFAYQPAAGAKQIFLQDEIFYIPGNTVDGVKPLSVIEYAKESIGLASATQQYGSRYFKNNASPGGVIEHPSTLSDEAYQRFKKDWEDRHQGSQNSHRMAILEEGMKWSGMGMTAQDAQFVESRKVSSIEICQYFRMPPHKVQILGASTKANIEQQSLEFWMDTLVPWLVKFEESGNRDLLKTADEQLKYFYKFDVNEILRGDIKTRYESYSKGLQNGFMSRNEVREKEGMQPFEGGDEYMIQLNMGSGAEKEDVEKTKDLEKSDGD